MRRIFQEPVDVSNGESSMESKPAILIVDDDAVTLGFLQAAIASAGRPTLAAADAAGAMTLAAQNVIALLFIDRHLPDRSGIDLLRALRREKIDAPAIGTSAEVDAGVRSEMMAAGFAEVIAKPIGADALVALVRRFLPADSDRPTSLLDDAGALAATGGNPDTLKALRQLLAQELDEFEQRHAVMDRLDANDLLARLHRLRASCGFCGASALAERAEALQMSLRSAPDDGARGMTEFLAACRATAQALRA